MIKAGEGGYLFARFSDKPANPFADLEHLFGIITLDRTTSTPREKIRQRLRKNRVA